MLCEHPDQPKHRLDAAVKRQDHTDPHSIIIMKLISIRFHKKINAEGVQNKGAEVRPHENSREETSKSSNSREHDANAEDGAKIKSIKFYWPNTKIYYSVIKRIIRF